MIRLLMPVFFILLAVAYLVFTFQLPESQIGNPNGPRYFPALIGFFLLLISIIYCIQEWKQRKEELEEVKQLFTGRTPYLIGSTLVLILIYTFLFERIGFLYSTILFLGGLLFVVNGRKKWLINIVVAVIFSFVSWYSFSELLQVSLP
ncbi:tripartite tricarboxylate transporter TctB family protein [Thalassobacillus sp. CUG 92003]|uniref:tripartite tricarboxylate transporter TctB family protein n=1 Tax=Thalassobacillus sp. CUG 92003 TaxID=2736641 RepID=UPI0015E6F460|nr:tripartite tricarboxylate transporter TctB family protein [Thalassobacillus sp. CUG 92003]